MTQRVDAAIHWFRRGLRLHDNPALVHALKHARRVYPLFVIDPWFADPARVGVNRYAFMLDSLRDLDKSLRKFGSRLYVVRGKPEVQLPAMVSHWGARLVTYELDASPFSKRRDEPIAAQLRASQVDVVPFCSHNLHPHEAYVKAGQGVVMPATYASFLKTFEAAGPPRRPLPAVTAADFSSPTLATDGALKQYDVPTLAEMGYGTQGQPSDRFPGGETEALRRMNETVSQRHSWVAAFEKPNTAPNSLEPSTTVLSPYLKFGCLSPATFYYELDSIYKKQKTYSKPPVSLHGQLLWREYFYLCSAVTPNFDKMVGNPMCRQIDWDCDERLHQAFVSARTGYPFIDACMTQLKQEGWIHHLARHALACFYTRGDLWQSWERGAKVFDELLLDSDWALNNANWQWLSCSRWFYQYFRCYSPVAFGKKTDPNGDYIRRYVPQLAKYPSKYIFEPWNAPLSVQRESGCLIGDGADCGYPAPIVDHQTVSAANMQRMRAAYARAGHGADAEPASEAATESSTTSQDARGKRKTIKSEPSAPITSFFNSKKSKTT